MKETVTVSIIALARLSLGRLEYLQLSVVRLWCAFTTPSMAIAYASLKSPKPKVIYMSGQA